MTEEGAFEKKEKPPRDWPPPPSEVEKEKKGKKGE